MCNLTRLYDFHNIRTAPAAFNMLAEICCCENLWWEKMWVKLVAGGVGFRKCFFLHVFCIHCLLMHILVWKFTNVVEADLTLSMVHPTQNTSIRFSLHALLRQMVIRGAGRLRDRTVQFTFSRKHASSIFGLQWICQPFLVREYFAASRGWDKWASLQKDLTEDMCFVILRGSMLVTYQMPEGLEITIEEHPGAVINFAGVIGLTVERHSALRVLNAEPNCVSVREFPHL